MYFNIRNSIVIDRKRPCKPQDFKAFIVGNKVKFVWSVYEKQSDVSIIEVYKNDIILREEFIDNFFERDIEDSLGKWYIIAKDVRGLRSEKSNSLFIIKEDNKYVITSEPKEEVKYVDEILMTKTDKIQMGFYSDTEKDKLLSIKIYCNGVMKKFFVKIKPKKP